MNKVPRFVRLKVLFAFLFLSFLILPAFAEVTVDRARISTRSPRIYKQGWTDFQCLVRNTDPKKHKVEVRVVPKDLETQTGFYSGQIVVQPKTELILNFPIRIEIAENYSVDVKVDGVRQPNNIYNDTPVVLFPNNARSLALVNDSDDTPGALAQLPQFKGKVFTRSYTAETLPSERLYFAYDDAMLFYRPDFSKLSQSQYDMIRSFVAEGGKLVFLHPEAIQNAASTPLADLLPVIPLGIRKIFRMPNLEAFLPDLKNNPADGYDFLLSMPKDRGVNVVTYDDMPLIRQMQYGLGTVVTVHFPVSEAFRTANPAAMEQLIIKCSAKQELNPNRQVFVDILDNLTGFAIPDTGRIVGLLCIYFVVFLAILVLGFCLKKPCLTWSAAALFACGAVLFILNMAAGSFSARHSVLAEIALEMPSPYPVSETFASCFSMNESYVNAGIGGENARFTPIPQSPRISSFFMTTLEEDYEAISKGGAKKKKTVRLVSPLEVFREPDSDTSVKRLYIQPRTSKQFMCYHSPRVINTNLVPEKKPELIFSKDEMTLAPYTLPEELMKLSPESVWLIMPNGSRPVILQNDGSLALTGASSVFVDPMARSIITALCQGLRKGSPYLAVVTDLKQNVIQLKTPMIPQGKHIYMIPCGITVKTRTFTLPPEMLTFSPGSSISRSIFRGNEIIPAVQLMSGQAVQIRVSFPDVFASVFTPEKVNLMVRKQVPDMVRFSTLLIRDGQKGSQEGDSLSAKPGPDGAGIFEKDVAGFTSNSGNALTFSLETVILADSSGMSPEQAMYANRWNLRGLKVQMTGSLPDSIPLPASF